MLYFIRTYLLFKSGSWTSAVHVGLDLFLHCPAGWHSAAVDRAAADNQEPRQPAAATAAADD